MLPAFHPEPTHVPQVFKDALAAAGLDPATLDVRMELPSNEAVRATVEAGAGATFYPGHPSRTVEVQMPATRPAMTRK